MPRHNRSGEYADTPGDTMLAGHFHETDRYFIGRPEGRDDWLIVMTLSGEGYFRTPAGEKRCPAGQIAILRAGIPHEYGTMPGQQWNFFWAHFGKLSETSYLPEEEVLVSELPEGETRKRAYRAFRSLLRDSRERSAYWQALFENAIRELLLLVAQRLEKRLDPRIEQALQFLSQNMQEEIRLERVAAAVGLSSSRLSHLFKQEMDVPILDYLNGMRLRQAALLMRHMGRSATEASLDVGFNNYNHFAALFRRMYGVSPRGFSNSR
ncbi:helix-turn-helix domain-containing protein [Cohnella cellulosilytica]|uniref:Helix-turn-helix domain-containing protein n=1 Tax=Cohnella cellulosilytica TaxID=986710 RepID=A0ABW2FGC5_9BACL